MRAGSSMGGTMVLAPWDWGLVRPHIGLGPGRMVEGPHQEQDGAALVVQQGPGQAQHGHAEQLLQRDAPARARHRDSMMTVATTTGM